jgi:ribosome-binding protein aMBF1 (putative translation factor)
LPPLGAAPLGTVILVATVAMLGVDALAALVLSILFSVRAGTRELPTRIELATEYVRGLMADTYRHYRPALKASRYAPDIVWDVRGYAATFTLTVSDLRLLAVCDETKKSGKKKEDKKERKKNKEAGQEIRRKPHGYRAQREAFLAAGEQIRMRYDNFLRYIVNAEDYECERYLAMRKNMRVVIEKWYHRHIGSYASVHRRLIERNISLVMQRVTDEREEFERTGGTATYLQLLSETAFYHNPEKDGVRELIPNKNKYKTFCTVVRRLEKFNTRGMAMPGRRSLLDDYKMLIDAYEDYVKQYTLVGCRTLEIERYRKRHDEVLKDVTRCFHCHTPFHKRYRQVCPRCEHFLCPVCGACYCNKFIYHFFSFETPGES